MKFRKYIFSIILILILVIPVWANSAEPPSILVIVPNAPIDLNLNIGEGSTYKEASRRDKLFESYYLFYLDYEYPKDDIVINATNKEYKYTMKLGKMDQRYNNVFSLDLRSGEFVEGKLPFRAFLYIILRLSITLVIEGAILLIMGFRRKRTWVIFVAVNLITQGALNYWINTVTYNDYSLFFGLIFYEFIILIAEMVAFLSFGREKSKGYRILYVLLANIISFLIGGYILTVLPY